MPAPARDAVPACPAAPTNCRSPIFWPTPTGAWQPRRGGGCGAEPGGWPCGSGWRRSPAGKQGSQPIDRPEFRRTAAEIAHQLGGQADAEWLASQPEATAILPGVPMGRRGISALVPELRGNSFVASGVCRVERSSGMWAGGSQGMGRVVRRKLSKERCEAARSTDKTARPIQRGQCMRLMHTASRIRCCCGQMRAFLHGRLCRWRDRTWDLFRPTGAATRGKACLRAGLQVHAHGHAVSPRGSTAGSLESVAWQSQR